MLGLSRRLRVFTYGTPTDMRKSFNTRFALVLSMGSLIETAKLNRVSPKRYLKVALAAALASARIPLPFELKPEA